MYYRITSIFVATLSLGVNSAAHEDFDESQFDGLSRESLNDIIHETQDRIQALDGDREYRRNDIEYLLGEIPEKVFMQAIGKPNPGLDISQKDIQSLIDWLEVAGQVANEWVIEALKDLGGGSPPKAYAYAKTPAQIAYWNKLQMQLSMAEYTEKAKRIQMHQRMLEQHLREIKKKQAIARFLEAKIAKMPKEERVRRPAYAH